MCEYSISSPRLSLVGPLKTEIYYRRKENLKHKQIETDTFPIYNIGSSNNIKVLGGLQADTKHYDNI